MKWNTYITGYHTALKSRFLVLAGGSAETVERFNRGDFGPYNYGMDKYEKGSFKLEKEPVEMY